MALLEQLPTLLILERFPVPVLAIAADGTILFANTAFADMVGRTPEAVKVLTFAQIFHTRNRQADMASGIGSFGQRHV